MSNDASATVRPRQRRRFELDVGETVGGYRVVASLGGGGMGVVYVAEHLLLGRRAAIKVLRPELSHSADLVQRFFAEARATTQVRHPGIVEVYDFGYTEDELAYLVMELLDGVSLAERLERDHHLPFAAAILIARRIALALSAAHERGIVHRDVKPDNIFLIRDGDGGPVPQIKLLDFGIARLVEEGALAGRKTSTGVVMGTPIYMSPEQCQSTGQCDHRSDLYSFGCLWFEMMTGQPPFVADSAFELMAAHISTPPPDVRDHAEDVPAEVAAIIERLLAKDPRDRFQTARELIAALDAAIERHGVERRSAAMATIAAPMPRRASSQVPIPRRGSSQVKVAGRGSSQVKVAGRRRWSSYAAAAAGLVAAVATVAIVVVGAGHDGGGAPPTPPPAPPPVTITAVKEPVVTVLPAPIDAGPTPAAAAPVAPTAPVATAAAAPPPGSKKGAVGKASSGSGKKPPVRDPLKQVVDDDAGGDASHDGRHTHDDDGVVRDP